MACPPAKLLPTTCLPGSPAPSEPATSTELLVLGRVPVFGKIVAQERTSSPQRAEQLAAQMRASGLEAEIRNATA